MTGNRRYVLDSNVCIEAKNRYYSFSLCPGFWKALERQHDAGQICSIDRVRSELIQPRTDDRPPDLLSDWAETKAPDFFFKGTQDQAVFSAFQKLIKWVHSQPQYSLRAKSDFAGVADGWVVANALVNKQVVVTHEEYAADAKKKIPIPNLCLEFDVLFVNTFEMLEELKVSFLLKTKRTR